jgi:hypothetical protein
VNWFEFSGQNQFTLITGANLVSKAVVPNESALVRMFL